MDCLRGLFTWIVYIDCSHGLVIGRLLIWVVYIDCLYGLLT